MSAAGSSMQQAEPSVVADLIDSMCVFVQCVHAMDEVKWQAAMTAACGK